MKFSYNWLKRWVDLDLDVEDLAKRLTASGLEVDAVQPAGAKFEDVVVGKILECKPHPNADKLVLCTVEAGGMTLFR
jgi:phenylalanyl-tRNA synthetase beta chain